MKKNVKLPDKLSDLIDVALKDLEAVERDPRYVIDMDSWHNAATKSQKCEVCFAGSVMAKSYKVSRKKEYSSSQFPFGTSIKFEALNYIRSGEVLNAIEALRYEQPSSHEMAVSLRKLEKRFQERLQKDRIEQGEFEDYKHPEKFKEYMRRFAVSLRELGL